MSDLIFIGMIVALFSYVVWGEPAISNWLWRNGYRPNVLSGGLWSAARNGFKTLPDSPNAALERVHEAQRQKMAKIYEMDERRLAK